MNISGKFIKLTFSDEGNLYINTSDIKSFYEDSKGETRIFTSRVNDHAGGSYTLPYKVKETPEEIMELINN